MAFYGLQWTPQEKVVVDASEATPLQSIDIAYDIRVSGLSTTLQAVTTLENEYAQSYAQAIEYQQQLTLAQNNFSSQTACFPPFTIESIMKTAEAWRGMTDDFHKYYGELDDNTKLLVEKQYKILELEEYYHSSERALWEMNERLIILRQISELWKFEVSNAQSRKTTLLQAEKQEKQKQAELQKAMKLYLTQVRRHTKYNRLRTKKNKDMEHKASLHQEEHNSLLSVLDNLLRQPQPNENADELFSPLKKTSRTATMAKNFFQDL